jgi:hypothetical protein
MRKYLGTWAGTSVDVWAKTDHEARFMAARKFGLPGRLRHMVNLVPTEEFTS